MPMLSDTCDRPTDDDVVFAPALTLPTALNVSAGKGALTVFSWDHADTQSTGLANEITQNRDFTRRDCHHPSNHHNSEPSSYTELHRSMNKLIFSSKRL